MTYEYDDLTPARVDELLLDAMNEYEQRVQQYAQLSDEAAEAESDFKAKYYAVIIRLRDQYGPRELTVDQREAMAEIECDSEHRAHRIMQGRLDAMKAALRMCSQRIDVLRTVAANLREVV